MFQTLALAATLSLSNDGLVARPPAEVRMSADRLEMIDQAVRKGMNAGGYPGAAVIVGRKGAIVYDRGFGKLSWGVGSPAVTTRESIYDLASLTKVVATTTAAMILYDEGKLDLDAPVQRYVPDFVGARKNEATVSMLLAHRAGLAAGRELWRKAT
jgi:serine-type D-Ala-D-Ala carboxypeptidase